MSYDVNVTAVCEDSLWDSDTEKFPANVKSLIDGLNVDYKFKIVSAGVQRTSYDSENTIGISRNFISSVKASFTVDELGTVQNFENSLASGCNKIDTNYKLRIRTKNHIS